MVIPEAAASGDAPVFHDTLSTKMLAHKRWFRYGDPRNAFAQANRIVSFKVSYPRVNSTPSKPGVIADYNTGNRHYAVLVNFQGPYALHPICAMRCACAAMSCA